MDSKIVLAAAIVFAALIGALAGEIARIEALDAETIALSQPPIAHRRGHRCPPRSS